MTENSRRTDKHPYHLVDPSPWPIVGSIAAGVLTAGAVFWIHGGPAWIWPLGFLLVLATMFGWWRDVINEATYRGNHTPVVQLGLRYGMLLFIASEVMFFVAFFWAYFNAGSSRRRHGESGRPRASFTFDPFRSRCSTR